MSTPNATPASAGNHPVVFGDIGVSIDEGHVALVEIHRPPHNFFSLEMIHDLANAYEYVDGSDDARAIVLATEGKNFCAGADFSGDGETVVNEKLKGRHLYDEAVRLFECRTPVVAAVQGAAIGGGLGVAASADFRVGGPGTRMAANFARLGFHHGFGLTVTLPAVVGQQNALRMLYTGVRLRGEEASQIGLLDYFVADDRVRETAFDVARDIAQSAPLAVESIRLTMRGHLPDAIRAATDREKAEQDRHRTTNDWVEGTAAMAERRTPVFTRS